jgi:aspartate carbamoyltransferase catalytic subunit
MNPLVSIMDFKGRDILSLFEFTRRDIEKVFKVADKLEPVVKKRTRITILKDKVLGTLFFQPSTRTRLSFESAMLRLGGAVTGFADAKVSRAGDKFQESIADTAKVIENYVDAVAIRHFQDGVAAEFAKHITIPVINGGDGQNEHPTQGLLDLITIKKELGRINGIDIIIIGDMIEERAIHSLLYGLAKFDDVKVHLVSPDNQRLPQAYKKNLNELNLKYDEGNSIYGLVENADVIYSDGIKTSKEGAITPDQYIVDAKKLVKAKRDMIVMHPLPRLDELSEDVDSTPHARYFKETMYGVIARMAVLTLVFGREEKL